MGARVERQDGVAVADEESPLLEELAGVLRARGPRSSQEMSQPKNARHDHPERGGI